MMTQELGISILAAPLASIDRRALSQAWYSALRCARDVEARQAAPQTTRAVVALQARAHANDEAASRAQRGPRALPARATAAANVLAEREPAPRSVAQASRASLARRIAAALADPGSSAGRATFSIRRGGARVHVIFQTNGDRVTVLAICRPEVRAFVARSLAYVCVALRSRGVAIEFEAKGTAACS